MPYLFRTLALCLLSGLFATGLQGQSLIEDAARLVEAKRLLEQPVDSLNADSIAQAFANTMAILQQYDASDMPQSETAAELLKTAEHYQHNQVLAEWLPFRQLKQYAEVPDSLSMARYKAQRTRLQRAPREQMARALKSNEGQTMADYLSISKALQRYTIPPVESRLALKSAAKTSNRNIDNGMVNTSVLLEGVFHFVLERAQQEVATNFLDRFLEKEVPPVKLLFPTVFSEVSSTSFSYSQSFLDRVRSAFYQDLQLLSVRLPIILLEDERFEALQTDPIMYNLLTVYTIIGLSQNEIPLGDVMSVTHRNLFSNYEENGKKLNFTLADTMKQGSGFDKLHAKTKTVTNLLSTIYLGLNEAENILEDSLQAIENRRRSSTDSTTVQGATPHFSYLFKPAYNLGTLMSDEAEGYRLNFLPYLLQGRLDSAYLMGIRSVPTYDRYFAEEPTERMLIAAGLEIARRLDGAWYEDQTLADLLDNWVADLTLYHRRLNEWKYKVLPKELDARVYQNLELKRQTLFIAVENTKAYWGNRDSLSYQQGLAFQVLGNMLSEPYDINSPAVRIELLSRKVTRQGLIREWQEELQSIEERLFSLNERIMGEDAELPPQHPISIYLLGQQPAHPYSGLVFKVQQLKNELSNLKTELRNVDTSYAAVPYQLQRNAEPMLFLTESVSQLTYCLRSSDPVRMWIERPVLDSALNDSDLRPAFLGLLYQRMRQVKQIRDISPDGLAQLVQLTVADLPALTSPDTLTIEQDTLLFYRKAAFVVNTLNRILELPLMVDPNNNGQLLPLVESNPRLKPVPEISQKLLDMVYHLNRRDHRQAMGATLGLFTSLAPVFQGDPSGQKELSEFLSFLTEYGYFIAGLVDAQSTNEVQSLMEGIADPPGSSRLKRKKDVTVALNAYLGASTGQETWEQNSSNTEETFINVMPTMPIGFSISRRLGKRHIEINETTLQTKQLDGHSISLFLSLIDLGSFFTYVPGDTQFGETDLTFKNVFRPGLQLHYNFKNSPFYTGVGAQYGPQYRELQGEQITLQSTRFFLSFGVDVPLKTLFVR
ncbi:MAG: hypothetical protein RIC19_02110 [Phaeodactylibacter sp.]